MRYVFGTDRGAVKRYGFPTHLNDLVIDRTDAATSEVFMVEIEPGKATPVHKHDDAEQVYYVIDGAGELAIRGDSQTYPVGPGDVVRIPPSVWHAVKCTSSRRLRYVCVDCFLGDMNEAEPTWDAHVKALCGQQGWDFDSVVGK